MPRDAHWRRAGVAVDVLRRAGRRHARVRYPEVMEEPRWTVHDQRVQEAGMCAGGI